MLSEGRVCELQQAAELQLAAATGNSTREYELWALIAVPCKVSAQRTLQTRSTTLLPSCRSLPAATRPSSCKEQKGTSISSVKLQLEEWLLRDKLDTLCGGPGHANTVALNSRPLQPECPQHKLARTRPASAPPLCPCNSAATSSCNSAATSSSRCASASFRY